jgi:hypothetical protein
MGEYLQGEQPQIDPLSTINPANYGVVDSRLSEYGVNIGQGENGCEESIPWVPTG